jgi:hypothetical protein
LAVAAFGAGSTGTAFTETNRIFTINGVKLALPTDGNISSDKHFQPSSVAVPYDPASPGTNFAGANGGNSYYYAKGTTGTTGLGSTLNTAYDDLLAIWDSVNTGTGTDSDGTPSGWKASSYWSSTPSANGRAGVTIVAGRVDDYPVNSSTIAFVALQVLNPATFTAALYNATSDTFTLTGTDLNAIGGIGEEVKGFIDWNKFGYDTDRDGTANITFTASDIISAQVTGLNTLSITLASAKASSLEASTNFDTTNASTGVTTISGGADRVILSENFASTGNGTSRATSTNAASGESKAATLEASQAVLRAGQSSISLGIGNGNLIQHTTVYVSSM